MSQAEIKPYRVTNIHQHKLTYTFICGGDEVRKWARDYLRDRFSVWTSDEVNVNCVSVERREGEEDAWMERSEH